MVYGKQTVERNHTPELHSRQSATPSASDSRDNCKKKTEKSEFLVSNNGQWRAYHAEDSNLVCPVDYIKLAVNIITHGH